MGAAGSVSQKGGGGNGEGAEVVFLTPENTPKKTAGGGGAAGDQTTSSFQPTTFTVQLMEDCPAFAPARLPRTFLLRVSVESLDFITDDADTTLLLQVPFQTIQSWGSNVQAFKITIFDHARVSGGSEVVLILKTLKGRAIEDCTVAAVQRLMNAMESHCLRKAEFEELRWEITDASTGGLVEQWREKIFASTGDLLLSSRQIMDLCILLGPRCSEFERNELVSLLYSKILHRDAFQLVINTFEDIKDRENIVHLLTRQDSASSERRTSGAFYDAHSGKKKDQRAKKLFAFQAGCFMLRHSVLDNTRPQEPGAGRGRHEVDDHGAKPGPET